MAEQFLIQFRAEAKNAFHELRRQAAHVPEMSLDEINTEISAVRAERKRRLSVSTACGDSPD